jgi:hypothetical protein
MLSYSGRRSSFTCSRALATVFLHVFVEALTGFDALLMR